MSLISRVVAGRMRLPPAYTSRVVRERDLGVPMRDGVILLADRYTPRSAGPLPTVLVRSPYGRRGMWGLLFGRLFAERGFTVLLQSVRGTFGSGGTLSPFREHDDGVDTVAWIERQPWFSGALATTGLSYLGLTQWALAADAGRALKAVAIQASTAQFHGPTYPGGSYALANSLSWTHLIGHQERRNALFAKITAARTLRALFGRLPLGRLDALTTGGTVDFWQDWLDHPDREDPYWEERSYDGSVGRVQAPVAMTAGWYDIFLPWQLTDYAALRAAGQVPRLTIGPWSHTSPGLLAQGHRDTLAHLRTHLVGDTTTPPGPPVRIFVTGVGEWRDYPDWPPPATVTTRWHLQGEAALSTADPEPSPPDRYRYDPADPTPAVSGAMLASGRSDPTDNRALETRPDVLIYTGEVLAQPVEAIGPVSADLYVSSSLEHTDFFVRLCDVHPDGRSLNVCDGLVRVRPGMGEPQPDGSRRITVAMWPTAHRFDAGHRLRVQVSSGAHPRFARNPGTGESLRTATTLLPADQAVHHDPDHPSGIILSVLPR